ncbi:ABC transporter substrate-binding protein [Kineococcus sp. SYSU DK001]|uniref:ABC transporter substrate-binding protein n=1 Tax=Kineococcus sp. SYSU DK001 TaxID=3383122 RepID=UPI003D7CD0D1
MSTLARRTVLASGAALGTAATLAACGGGSGSSSSGPVTLRFAWWGSDARHQYTQKIIDDFNASQSGIVVKGEFAEWSGYWDKIATQTAANDAPDVFQMDAIYLRSYGDRGALLDLSELEGLDTSGIEESALQTGQTPDGLLGLVTGIVPLAMVTNPGIVTQAGLQLPDDTAWTWDDYEKLSAGITAAGLPNVYGCGTGGIDEAGLQLWCKQNGGALYDEDGKVVLETAQLVDWWEYNLGLVASGAATPVSVAMERATAALDQNGMALNLNAFSPMWATQVTALTKASGQPLQLLRPPTQTVGGAPGLYYKPGMFWSVSARSKNPEAAATFLSHLVSDPGVADLMLTERGIPANTTIREQITPKLSETDKIAVAYTDSLADVVAETPPSAPAGASGIEEIVRRYGSDVLFGKQQPPAAAEALVDELTQSVETA